MNQKQWLDEFNADLIRAGLPTEYVRRCEIELTGHLEEGSQSEESDCWLGEPSELARSFVLQFRSARWYRRVPAGVWCLLSMPLAVFATICFFEFVAIVYEEAVGFYPRAEALGGFLPVIEWCYFVGKLASPLIAAYVLLRLLRDIGRPAWLRGVCLGVLSVSFLFVLTELQWLSASDVDLSLNVTSDGLFRSEMLFWQMSQALMVLVAGVLDWRRRRVVDLDGHRWL
ncbi:MAG: hypothetical protein AAF989_01950 [Planctomycetota bacterium]